MNKAPMLLVLTSLTPPTVTAMSVFYFLKKHEMSDLMGGIHNNTVTVIVAHYGDQPAIEHKLKLIKESERVGYEIDENTTFDYLSIDTPTFYTDFGKN